MKNKKVLLITGVSIMVLLVYAYWTITPADRKNDRRLIVSNATQVSGIAVEKSVLTKSEAYDAKAKENSEADSKLAVALENERPQRLAESITKAMKSPYEMKLEALKSDRATVPVYDGKPYSIEPAKADTEQTLRPLPVAEQLQSAPLTRPARKRTERKPQVVVSSQPATSVPAPAPVHADIFNTTSIDGGAAPEKAPNQTAVAAPGDGGVIKAGVFGDQNVKADALLRFRLLEPLTLDGVSYPRNTLFSGKCSFGQDRLLVTVDKLPSPGGGYKKVNLIIHDPTDLQEGILAPRDASKEGAMDATAGNIEKMIGSVGSPQLNLGTGVARVFRTAVSGTPTIHVPDGLSVVFLNQKP